MALNQKHFTGDTSVLLKLFSSIKSFLEEGEALYVDLSGKHASKNPQFTVPTAIYIARQDMVLNRGLKIALIELITL